MESNDRKKFQIQTIIRELWLNVRFFDSIPGLVLVPDLGPKDTRKLDEKIRLGTFIAIHDVNHKTYCLCRDSFYRYIPVDDQFGHLALRLRHRQAALLNKL